MAGWTSDELAKIGAADELQIATLGPDDTLRNPVTTWVARVGDDLYVRAVNGPKGKWYRHALERHQGRIQAGGVSKDVTFQEVGADDPIQDDIDAAYKSKYNRYSASIVNTVLTPQARAATLKLVPLS